MIKLIKSQLHGELQGIDGLDKVRRAQEDIRHLEYYEARAALKRGRGVKKKNGKYSKAYLASKLTREISKPLLNSDGQTCFIYP
jgi:hypothetical protein